jgi:hypothetical protein
MRTSIFGALAIALALFALFRVFRALHSQNIGWGPAWYKIQANRQGDPTGYWSIVVAHLAGATFFIWLAYRILHGGVSI